MDYTGFGESPKDELSLREAMANILRGLGNKQNWQQLGQGVSNAAAVVPNTVESLARGGVAQAVGAVGDLRDLNQTIKSYMPEPIQNLQTGMEFFSNPLAQALVVPKAPTTKSTLDFVPRITSPYEGYEQHEELGTYIAPTLAKGGAAVEKGALKASDKAVQMITGNPEATASKVIDYASTFSPVKAAPQDLAQSLRKNEMGLYSTLEEAIDNLPQEKGTGTQILAQLLKTPAVKQEEITLRGLDQFLENSPKVTKDEIKAYLKYNKADLKETVLDEGYQGTQRTDLVEDYRIRDGDIIDDYDYIDSRADDYFDEFANDPNMRIQERDALLSNYADDFADLDTNPATAQRLEDEIDNVLRERAKDMATDEYYSNPYMRYYDDYGYEIIGNDDVGYMLRDPNGRDITPSRGIYDLSDAEDILRDRNVEQGNLTYEAEGGPKYADYQLKGPKENYREILIHPTQTSSKDISVVADKDGKFRLKESPLQGAPTIKDSKGQDLVFNTSKEANRFRRTLEKSEPYQSSHFDEENILAHMRVNDRVIDGKKTLFIEEIQSDWHQEGRKKGYQTKIDEPRRKQIEKELNALSIEKAFLRDQRAASKQEGLSVDQYDRKLAEVEREQVELRKELENKSGVPDAPYKKNWQELAMRRAIQMAVEGGYDRVAFTTGAQQADRYNLAKQVNSIDWNPYESRGANKLVTIVPKNGNRIELPLDKDGNVIKEIGGQFGGKAIDDIVGKDIAKKIMDSDNGDLSGQGLSIGGEGMKGFYDKILPDYVNKYGKKYGMKVGKTNLENEPVHYFDITPEAKKSLLEKGSPLFAAPALSLTDEETRKEMLERLFKESQK